MTDTKKRILIGLGTGVSAGIIDVTPMILQHLGWDANLSAFSLWVVAGIMIALSSWNVRPVVKGLLYPFLIMIPTVILIAWKEPLTLIPIISMTLLLGSLSGIVIDKIMKRLL